MTVEEQKIIYELFDCCWGWLDELTNEFSPKLTEAAENRILRIQDAFQDAIIDLDNLKVNKL